MRASTQGLWLVVVGLLLVGCGGGGGVQRRDVAPQTGSVQVSIVDEFDGPVGNASIVVAAGNTSRTGTTANDGSAAIADVPVGSAQVTVTAAGFENGSSTVSISANQSVSIALTLTRITEPAAGLFAAELNQSVTLTDGQTLTFAVEVLVVDDNSAVAAAIETLTAADFVLQPCVDADPAVVECLRGIASQPDVGYSVVSSSAENFQLTPGQATNPYAATLMIDQSGSIQTNDPSDARLFATKVFLNNLGPTDYASVSAFAQELNANEPALIPDEPVTRLSGFIQSNSAQSVYADIDGLASLEGGDTPLFAALDQELEYTAANGPVGGNQRRAVVLFTDGDDSVCRPTSVPACGIETSIQKSIDLGVDIFTIGLGADIDVDVLRRLAEGGRGFFLFAENAQQLFPIYRSLGELLSRTLATYRMEWTIRADVAAAYQPGQTILGVLNIDTGSNQIQLPVRLFLQ